MQLIIGIMIGILIASVGWAYLAFRINEDWYIAATESDERWAKFCHKMVDDWYDERLKKINMEKRKAESEDKE